MKRVLLETATVLGAGAVLALFANQVSPRGLNLARDYFPKAANTTVLPKPATNAAATNAAATNAVAPGHSSQTAVADRLRQKGLQPIEHDSVVQLYRDPQFNQGIIVFVDARDDEHYQAGHIPGAYQFDHYHLEKYLPPVLPVCMAAAKVVVYCNGGECEDSEYGTIMLNQAGMPMSKLFVYAGGITEWSSNGLPVETGDRNSGKLKPARP